MNNDDLTLELNPEHLAQPEQTVHAPAKNPPRLTDLAMTLDAALGMWCPMTLRRPGDDLDPDMGEIATCIGTRCALFSIEMIVEGTTVGHCTLGHARLLEPDEPGAYPTVTEDPLP